MNWYTGHAGVFQNGGRFEFFKFAAFEDDSETLSYCIIDSDEHIILLAKVTSSMRRSLNRLNRYFEVTIPAYLSGGISKPIPLDKRSVRVVGSRNHGHVWATCICATDANTPAIHRNSSAAILALSFSDEVHTPKGRLNATL